MAENIEEELQSYLAKKNIPDIFKDIMENILIHKPDNPIDFIHKYLPKKYPLHVIMEPTR
jgi:hypothetical protein